MKAIHYDAEGDILSATFTEAEGQNHTGIELTDNIVLYYNPETYQPLKLMVVSYQAMVHASTQSPIILDGLARMPEDVQSMIVALLQRAPLAAFFQVVVSSGQAGPSGRLREIFVPAALQLAGVAG